MQATFSGLRESSGNKEIMSRVPQVIGYELATLFEKVHEDEEESDH